MPIPLKYKIPDHRQRKKLGITVHTYGDLASNGHWIIDTKLLNRISSGVSTLKKSGTYRPGEYLPVASPMSESLPTLMPKTGDISNKYYLAKILSVRITQGQKDVTLAEATLGCIAGTIEIDSQYLPILAACDSIWIDPVKRRAVGTVGGEIAALVLGLKG